MQRCPQQAQVLGFIAFCRLERFRQDFPRSGTPWFYCAILRIGGDLAFRWVVPLLDLARDGGVLDDACVLRQESQRAHRTRVDTEVTCGDRASLPIGIARLLGQPPRQAIVDVRLIGMNGEGGSCRQKQRGDSTAQFPAPEHLSRKAQFAALKFNGARVRPCRL